MTHPGLATVPGASGIPPSSRTSQDPVFVLCMGRSGSTLLRFVLDAHPQLACPPETRLPAICANLAGAWSQLERLPTRPGSASALLPAVAQGVRETVAAMSDPYLARRGKQRYCDKSLGGAEHADLLAQIFPSATFICVYRHPMDVIGSGIEATPWGLSGFGFEPYAAGSPGNTVLALARYWAEHARVIRSFERRHPTRCHRVRYEDLVADPQSTADGLFDALAVPRLDDVAHRCFSPERERQGPADYKIWHTSEITRDSVGRGWAIPATLIALETRDRINELLDELDYRRIDSQWGLAASAPDLRLVGEGAAGSIPVLPAPGTQIPFPAAYHLIAQRVHAGMFALGEQFARRWQIDENEVFAVTAEFTSPAGRRSATWQVDLASRSVSSQATAAELGDSGPAWVVTGPADIWEQLFEGRINLGVALRSRKLRYGQHGEANAVPAANRTGMLGELLGLHAWPSQVLDQVPGESSPHSSPQVA